MKELQAWLDERAQREERVPCLDDVFLLGRFVPYAWYRLRLFFLRWLAASLVHVLRLLLLSAAFSRQSFVTLLLAETATGFVSSFWWGALEMMRERIRELRREGRVFAVPQEIERWMTVSWALAGAAIVACGAWLALRRRSFGPFELYAFALSVRMALQFVTRTFHSGVYAMRRVYRPGWAVVAVELILFGTVVLVWPVLGSWALPIATLVSACAGSGITLYFTRRMYRFIGLQPRWADLHALRQHWRVSPIHVVAAGLSFAIMKLDAVLVFGLFDHRAGAPADIRLFFLLFVMAPTIQAGFDWAYLFYFDLKRLHVTPLTPLLEEYRRRISQLALVMGLVFWILGSLTGTIVYLRSLGTLYWLLLPFFVVRALLASAQIQAFSVRGYGVLLGTSALWLAGFEAARRAPGDDGKLLAITAVSGAVYLVLARVAKPVTHERMTYVGIVEWLRLLGAVTQPVRVRSATLRPLRRRRGQARVVLRGIAWSQRQFARTLARRLGRSGAVTILAPDRVVWFEPGAGKGIRAATVSALSGGIAQAVRDSRVHSDGRAAAAAAWREHGFEAAFGPIRFDASHAPTPEELQRQFARLFPDGWVFAPGMPTPRAAALPQRWRRRTIRTARAFLDAFETRRDRSPFDVTAFSSDGRLRLVFITRADDERHATWNTRVRRANILSALHGPAAGGPAVPVT